VRSPRLRRDRPAPPALTQGVGSACLRAVGGAVRSGKEGTRRLTCSCVAWLDAASNPVILLRGGVVKRLVVFCFAVASLAFASSAIAATPRHESGSFSGSNTTPAGALCDFAMRTDFTATYKATIFGNPDNPTRVIEHDTINVVHTNVKTGATATEFNRGTSFFDAATGTTKIAGLFFWHLRDQSGKLVLNGAGQIVFSDGGVLKETPGLNADSTLICSVLGGSPA
jgi:hypothetical protein